MKKSELIDGALIATIAIIISKILGLVYVIPLNKVIGEDGGSLYGYAYTIYNFFLIISSAGIPLAISKITSEYNTLGMQKEKAFMFKYSKKLIRIFSIISFSICFFGANILANWIVTNPGETYSVADVAFVIRCVSFAVLIVPLLSISRGYLQGHKYITVPSLSQVIEQIVRVLVIIFGSYIAKEVLGLSIPQAVGVAVFGACAGAIVAYIYLLLKMRRVKNEITISDTNVTKKEKKEIFKKIIFYCIPFIIINAANNLYNFIDMILVKQGLNIVNFPVKDIATVSAVFTTWGSKLVSVVTAFATGLVISLIPSIVEANTKGNNEEVNNDFNKILQMLLYVILPLSIFISIFATQVWSIFYGESTYGPAIFRFTILLAILDSAYIMICSALQGLSKTKLIYISVAFGLSTKAILDIPMMLLFNKLGFDAYYGAIFDSLVGYVLSLGIPLVTLHKKYNFSYKDTLKTIPKLLASIILLSSIAFGLRYLLFSNYVGKLNTIIYLSGIGILCFIIYYILNKQLLNDLLGDKILKKLGIKNKKSSN